MALENKIKNFWQNNPLCAKMNPFEPGSPNFFHYYDKEKEKK